MTEFIAHRINKISQLKELPTSYGVELDLRDAGDKIILEHDPFNSEGAEDFEGYLKHYRHGTMILNVKSERVEHRVLELLSLYNIDKYFFLDSSFPMIYALTSKGEKNIALRFSEFESIDTLEKMSGRAKWVWVDCFSELPIDKESYKKLKSWGYKLCLVSPDLLGRREDIAQYMSFLKKENIFFDAICSKYMNFGEWNEL